MNELLDKVKAAFRKLSPREQILVGAAGGLVVIAILIFGLVTPFFAAADRAESRALAAEQQIAAMSRLRSEYDSLNARLSTVESRIRNNRERSNLRSLLENLASQSSVRIASMEERQAGKNDHYSETKLEVSLKNVTLSQTVKYLHNIESANRQLSVKSLRIKARADKSQTLDVTFSVSSFEPV